MAFEKLTDPLLEVSEKPLKDESIEKIEWTEHTQTTATPNTRQELEISVNVADKYHVPADAYLQICGRVTKAADGTAYDARDSIALVNNGVMALFVSARYLINGEAIEVVNNDIDIATTIHGLVQISNEHAETAGGVYHWAKDTSTHANMNPYRAHNVRNAAGDGVAATVSGANPNYNRGFHTRQNLILGDGNTGYFNAIIPLSHIFGFCRDVRKVIYGVQHTLYLQRRANDDQAIYRAAAVDAGQVELTKVSLWMPHVTPALEWRAKLEEWMAAKSAMTAYWQATQIDKLTAQNNAVEVSWKLSVKSGTERPRHIFVVFQLTNKQNNQEANPMIFDHLDLREIELVVNGERHPSSQRNIRYARHSYEQAYKMLLEFLGYDVDVSIGLQVTYREFRSLYPIYHFDLEKQAERLKEGITDIYVKAKFGEGPGNYAGYALVLSDRIMRIQGDGKKMNLLFGP